MGMIDNLFASLSGGKEATHADLAHATGALFGSDAAAGLGLTGLVAKLREAGFGEQMDSWIGGGPNLPIEPHDLHAALGDTEVQALAARANVPAGELLATLAQHLPGLVDRLTPNGHLPAA